MQPTTTSNTAGQQPEYTFIQRVCIAVGITLIFVLGTLLLGFSFDILLLIIASLLVALPLRAAAHWVSKKTKWKEGICMVLVSLTVLGAIVGIFWILSSAVGDQVSTLKEDAPEAIANFQKQVSRSKLGEQILSSIPTTDELMQRREKWMSQASGVLSSTFGTIADLYVIIFLGIFIAVQPRLYHKGIVLMIPQKSRKRASEVLNKVADTLVHWLMGQLISMTFVGILTFLGLWIMGVPLAGALGLFAAITAFIPNIGPIMALVPAVLFALMNSPEQAFYVVLLYVGIQAIESSLLTPLVQKKMINIPPALVLIAQLIVGVFSGILGMILATPIMAVVMVLVKMLYIQDTLKDDSVEV